MANDSMKKELVAHKVYSAWQFITYTEKNIDTVQYCADTINNIIGKMTMKTVRWQRLCQVIIGNYSFSFSKPSFCMFFSD